MVGKIVVSEKDFRFDICLYDVKVFAKPAMSRFSVWPTYWILHLKHAVMKYLMLLLLQLTRIVLRKTGLWFWR